MTPPGQVDTARTKDRRALRFADSAAMWADVDCIIESERAGTLRRSGNWSVGRCLGHLAAWAEFPYDGYPPEVRPPWWIKAAVRPFKGRILSADAAMPAGIRLRRLPEGTAGTEEMETEAAVARLRRAWTRLESTAPAVPNPLLGRLTHRQWIRINLQHAELHLGFLHPHAHTPGPART